MEANGDDEAVRASWRNPLMDANPRESIGVTSRSFADQNYNPDVLSCIANLSSDEVFTPPQLVNRILDLLPPELWSNKNTTF